MLQANASLSPGDIYAAMEDTAEDMGTPGVDFDSGFGLVRADLAIAAVGGNGGVPVVTPPADVTEEATGSMSAVSIGTATATDAEDGSLPTASNAPGMFPVGMTMVTWSATDNDGNTSTASQEVMVTDTTPPTVTVPADITVETTGTLTPVDVGTGTASDIVDGAMSPTNDSPGSFPVGTTVVTWSATDTASNTGTATQFVTVTAPGNIGPTANDDAYSTPKNETLTVTSLGVLANDDDPENGPLTASLQSNASNGTVSLIADGSFTYTPNKRFTGEDSFIYLLTDNLGATDIATVTITVTGGGGGGGGGSDGGSDGGGGGKPCNPRKEVCN